MTLFGNQYKRMNNFVFKYLPPWKFCLFKFWEERLGNLKIQGAKRNWETSAFFYLECGYERQLWNGRGWWQQQRKSRQLNKCLNSYKKYPKSFVTFIDIRYVNALFYLIKCHHYLDPIATKNIGFLIDFFKNYFPRPHIFLFFLNRQQMWLSSGIGQNAITKTAKYLYIKFLAKFLGKCG